MLIRQIRIPGTAGEPVDVLIAGARIAKVGADLSAGGGPVLDGAGRWVMPGLWDKHVHLGQWASARRRIDLSGTRSANEVLARLARAIDGGADEHDRTIVGFGYRLAGWDRMPTVAALDAVAGDRPVVLISGDAHNAWLSSAAFARAGLAPRDDVVAEREWFEAYPGLAHALALRPTLEDYASAIDAAHRLGVVGLVDFEFERGFERWAERADSLPPLRVRTAVYPDDLAAAVAAGMHTGRPLGGLATMGPFKVLVDGALGTRTAYCHEPYTDGDGERGVLNYDTGELAEMVRRADAAGLDVALHAIGDAALDVVLGVLEATGAKGSIEHVQLAGRDDLARMARLGLTASVQPAHLLDDRELLEACWGGRTGRVYPLRALNDHGVPMALGSDAPVAPLDPWLAIDVAVRRAADDGEAWQPEQALTRTEALGASVDGRRMAAGEPADLVLLDDDPLAASRPTVSATFIAGERVF